MSNTKKKKTKKWGVIFIIFIALLAIGSVTMESNNDELWDKVTDNLENQDNKIDIKNVDCYISKFTVADQDKNGNYKWYKKDNEVSYFYDTADHTPIFKAVYNGKELQHGKDYKIRFSKENRKKPGSYEVYFCGDGDYKGTKTIEYKIVEGSRTDIVKQIVYDDLNVGYNQDKRNYTKYNQVDCSSLVYMSLLGSGTFTRDQLGRLHDFRTKNLVTKLIDLGFKKIDFDKDIELKVGDLLLFRQTGADGHEWGHIATYMGNNNIAEADHDENGNVRGGKDGDQTTQEVRICPLDENDSYDKWQFVYRLP